LTRVAPQRNAQRASDQKAIGAFWSRAEKQRGEQVEAATAITGDVAKYGGEGAAVVAWARLSLRDDAERRAAQ
jgi:hypothetical protein